MFDDILGPFKKEVRKEAKKPDLIKLTRDEVIALKEGDDSEYWVKLIRLTYPNPTIKYKCKLYIQERKNGGIGLLTPKPDTIPISWAEYCEEEIDDDGNCVAGDYLMEIWKEE